MQLDLAGQPVFPDGEQKHHDGRQHQNGNGQKQRRIVLASRGVPRDQQAGGSQRKHPAQCAHQVDDGVALAAQGLGGYVRHERHGGGAVHAHRQKQQPQCHHKQPQAAGSIRDGQQVHQHHRNQRAAQDIGHTPAQARVRAVRQLAEKGQQKQRQHIVQRHDYARDIVRDIEGIFQNEGHHIVIQLPERTDGQKGQAHQERSLVIELHAQNLPYRNDDFFL